MKNQNYAEAVEQFKQALAVGASYDVLFDLGRAYRQYGLSFKDTNAKLFTENLTYAAERLEEATGYKADSLEAYFQLGMCYRDLKLYPQAMAAFQKAQRVAPQDLAIYYQMGMVAQEQGYMQEAQAYFFAGEHYLATRQRAAAQKMFQAVLARKDPWTYSDIGARGELARLPK